MRSVCRSYPGDSCDIDRRMTVRPLYFACRRVLFYSPILEHPLRAQAVPQPGADQLWKSPGRIGLDFLSAGYTWPRASPGSVPRSILSGWTRACGGASNWRRVSTASPGVSTAAVSTTYKSTWLHPNSCPKSCTGSSTRLISPGYQALH